MTNKLERLQAEYQEFIEQREWEKYHTPKSTAMAISIEAGELMELFQWHDNLQAEEYDEEVKSRVSEELADILIYSLSIAEQFDIDPTEAIQQKMEQNEERFDLKSVRDINQDLDQWVDE